jgi:hypothetical protein
MLIVFGLISGNNFLNLVRWRHLELIEHLVLIYATNGRGGYI